MGKDNETRTDTERLNWLAESQAHLCFSKDGDDCWLRWEVNPFDEEDHRGINQRGCFDSIREAIDAAMDSNEPMATWGRDNEG